MLSADRIHCWAAVGDSSRVKEPSDSEIDNPPVGKALQMESHSIKTNPSSGEPAGHRKRTEREMISSDPYFSDIPPITAPPNRINITVKCNSGQLCPDLSDMLHDGIAAASAVNSPHGFVDSFPVKYLAGI